MKEQTKLNEQFATLVGILDRLRSRNGCPWDREQNKDTITNYFLEEVYEAVDALISNDVGAMLGDVLLEIVFLALIYKEKGKFTIEDILDGINEKMIRRHPHVFGEEKQKTSKKVLEDWNRQKFREKNRQSFFDGFVNAGPALFNAFQIGQKVSSVGFDWEKPEDAIEKVKEETIELGDAIRVENREDIIEEMGDVLFAVANVSRLLGINPELALRKSNQKFMKRFLYVEKELKLQGKNTEDASLEEMDLIWEKSKSVNSE
jgi:MazG family protein